MTPDADREPVDAESVELLRRFADGDDAALARLVEKEGARLLPYIERKLPAYLRRRVGASDILQNTIVDLLEVRERFEDRGVPAFRRMLNVMADLALARAVERERAQKRDVARDRGPGTVAGGTGSQDGLAKLPGAGASPSAEVRRGEDRERLKRALDTLSSEDREILRLVDGEEAGYDAVARRLGVTPAAARKRHSRAVGRLRKLLEGDD
jgi:RNA polymerase sigma-70 factor (ECF subfamily)